jgi:hypothetical protein
MSALAIRPRFMCGNGAQGAGATGLAGDIGESAS